MPYPPVITADRHCTRRAFCLSTLATAFGLAGPLRAAPPPTGTHNPRLATLDHLMQSFIDDHNVPGAALAVTRGPRLVYARGFGYADVEERIPVQPVSLFRIASISKPFTAVAILHLAAGGRLRLTDRVRDLIKLKPLQEDGLREDPRLKKVTILQLLRHTGGWDRAQSFDPMFRPIVIARACHVRPPAGQTQIIRYMFGRPLDFDPGVRYAYSNFGYCLLGEVIREVTQQPYEKYVQEQILRPLGIHGMRLGHTLTQAPGEVRYYDMQRRTAPAVVGNIGRQVPLPYGAWFLEAMDSHGGWIASAIDLVRFARAFNDPNRCPVLGRPGIATMFSRPPGLAGFQSDGSPRDGYYGCGWQVRTVDRPGRFSSWHAGSLAGTSTLLVRRFDGFNWAVLFNSQTGVGGKLLSGIIDPLIHHAVDSVRAWPAHDLFPKYE